MQGQPQQAAIVTGGASGIGRAFSEALALKDVHVAIFDVNEEEGRRVASNIRERGGAATYYQVNVTDGEAFRNAVHDVHVKSGRLDYMFNNAGIVMYGELQDMTEAQVEKIVAINLWGVIHGTRAAYKIMKQQGFGRIINTASAAGLGPTPLVSAYAATKHAVVGLSTSLHYEAEDYGVHVSVLCPGHVATPIFNNGLAIGLDKGKIGRELHRHKMMAPDDFAAYALKAVGRGELIISTVPLRRTTDIAFLIFPFLQRKLMRLVCRVMRKAKIAT